MSSTSKTWSSRRLGISGAGVAGTVALHALIMLPLFLNLSLPPSRPDRSSGGAIALALNDEPVMTVVFLDDHSLTEDRAVPELRDVEFRRFPAREQVASANPDGRPVTHMEADPERPPEDSQLRDDDQEARPLLYRRYLVQTQARIERAWQRPRTEIGASKFSCRARIQQDRTGTVVGVTLDLCNGTRRWQDSLVTAIRSATPLPAPPDGSVYAARLWLSFESPGFEKGGSTEGFEPAGQGNLVATEWTQARESHLAAQGPLPARVREGSDVIRLTIVGDGGEAAVDSPSAPVSTTPSSE